MNKDVNEIIALMKLYNSDNERRYMLIDQDCEDPDFKLIDLYKNKKFGVEVTDLYYSSTSARIKKLPDFIEKALEFGVSKKDKKNLQLIERYLKIDDKWVRIKPRLQHKPVTADEFVKLLIECIQKKEAKFENYDKNLDYVELIIVDKENHFKKSGVKDLRIIQENEILSSLILNSKFERIYFFTSVEGNDMLLLSGNYLEGPLAITPQEFDLNQKYLSHIFHEKDKD